MRDVGDWSIEELKVERENIRGGVVLSLPLRGSNFCSKDLSYACTLLRYWSWTELWKPDLIDEGLEYLELKRNKLANGKVSHGRQPSHTCTIRC